MYLVLGKSGYIGTAFVTELKKRNLQYIALSRAEVDYTNFKEFSNYIQLHYTSLKNPLKKATIINCAGYVGKPNVDACEIHKGDTIMGNIVFPTNLANFCSTSDHTLVQISSGCIYDGYEKDFTEEDAPNFTFNNGSFYSGSKSLCERMILQHNPESYIFRLRIPFDQYSNPRNYITKLLTYQKLLDAKNSLSHRGDYARTCLDLLEQKAPKGIYNVTNPGSLSTSEAVSLITKYLKPNQDFNFFKDLNSFSQEVTAPRSNCILDTSKVERYTNIRPIQEAFIESLKLYA